MTYLANREEYIEISDDNLEDFDVKPIQSKKRLFAVFFLTLLAFLLLSCKFHHGPITAVMKNFQQHITRGPQELRKGCVNLYGYLE